MRKLIHAVLLIAAASALDVNIPIEHSLDGQTFALAGQLQGALFELASGRKEVLSFERTDLSVSERQQFSDLVESNGYFKLQITSDPGNADAEKIVTSVPARCLISTGLQDHLQIHATAQGRFVGFNHDFAKYPCSGQEAGVKLPADYDFAEHASVSVWLPVSAPNLRKEDAAVQDLCKGHWNQHCLDNAVTTDVGKKKPGIKAKRPPGSKGKAGEGEEAEEDTRPWIVRNWMIALPLGFVAVNVLGAIFAPPEAQSGGQQAHSRRR